MKMKKTHSKKNETIRSVNLKTQIAELFSKKNIIKSTDNRQSRKKKSSKSLSKTQQQFRIFQYRTKF